MSIDTLFGCIICPETGRYFPFPILVAGDELDRLRIPECAGIPIYSSLKGSIRVIPLTEEEIISEMYRLAIIFAAMIFFQVDHSIE